MNNIEALSPPYAPNFSSPHPSPAWKSYDNNSNKNNTDIDEKTKTNPSML